MNEFEIIDRIRQILGDAAGGDRVLVGPGDDAAIVTVPPGFELAVTTDTLVAGHHFPADAPGDLVGCRAMGVNLSDLAAMGADPSYCVVSLTVPSGDIPWIEAFARGITEYASRYGSSIVGGNMARGPPGHIRDGARIRSRRRTPVAFRRAGPGTRSSSPARWAPDTRPCWPTTPASIASNRASISARRCAGKRPPPSMSPTDCWPISDTRLPRERRRRAVDAGDRTARQRRRTGNRAHLWRRLRTAVHGQRPSRRGRTDHCDRRNRQGRGRHRCRPGERPIDRRRSGIPALLARPE